MLWVRDQARVPFHATFEEHAPPDWNLAFEKAGAREKIYFDPAKVRAGVVTCGGISPGLNDVIRALFMELFYVYGVRDILGFRYGLRGLNPANSLKPLPLTHDMVVDIHTKAGTMLGTARGHVDPKIIINYLRSLEMNMLFVVGGDGSQRAANAIWQEAVRQGYRLAIVGVPKTIDNDINFVNKTFGFDTAVSLAKKALDAAHTEAKGHPNGIGLVKVMGRDSGFIAAFATLASIDVNFALTPEVPFDLEGHGAFLEHLELRVRQKGHALIVVAEGAGQHLINVERERDASGNIKHADIGLYLKDSVISFFKERDLEVNLKYFDPSYMLRSLPSNAYDSIYAAGLARMAVHAAMAGKTNVLIGKRFGQYLHVPIPLAVRTRKKIDPKGELWLSVLQATGQPSSMRRVPAEGACSDEASGSGCVSR